MELPDQAERPLIDVLMPLVYEELKRIARGQLGGERRAHTLSPTALVHEAWLRLRSSDAPQDRQHFLALAARAMRHILVNHALARKAAKRDGGAKVSLAAVDAFAGADTPFDLLKLDHALHQLEQQDPRAAKLAELRAFAGLSLEDAAAALSISIATAKRDWVYAKLWLARELERD